MDGAPESSSDTSIMQPAPSFPFAFVGDAVVVGDAVGGVGAVRRSPAGWRSARPCPATCRRFPNAPGRLGRRRWAEAPEGRKVSKNRMVHGTPAASSQQASLDRDNNTPGEGECFSNQPRAAQ